MKDHNKSLILIDGNGLMHRAFHAYPPLTTSDGIPINAVYGFCSMLFIILKTFNPNYVICAFDVPKPTLRLQKYQLYKAHRVKMDESLIGQFPIVKEVLNAFNIPIVESEGYEADDVIGTLALQAEEKSIIETYIVTGDKDLLQLISPTTKVILPGKTFSDVQEYDEKKFHEKYGFYPIDFVDLKAITGDVSDNIPGVRGIGEKGALGLIQQYHSLEEIYTNIDKIDKRYRDKLVQYKEDAVLSKDLSQIIRDVPIDLQLNEVKDIDIEKVKTLFEKFEFRSLIKRLPLIIQSKQALENTSKSAEQVIVQDINDFEKLLLDIKKAKFLSLFVDYSGIKISDYSLNTLSISTNSEKYIYCQ